MPRHIGVQKKGKRFYGVKCYAGKNYWTGGYNTAQEAARARASLTKELQQGVVPNTKNITVREFAKLYLEKYLIPKPHLAAHTLECRERDLRLGVVRFIGGRKLRSLTPEDLQDLQNILLQHYATSSTRLIMGELRRMLKRAVLWHYIPYNPADALDPIRPEVQKPQILTLDQLSRLLNQSPQPSQTIIGLGALAGLRLAEVFGLKWDKVDFIHEQISIDLQYTRGVLKTPKAGSTRIVPILPDLSPILKAWKLQSSYPVWLFPGAKDKPHTPHHWVHCVFKPLLQNLGLPPIRFHALRHGFDKMLHDMGIQTRDVMQIMGHKSWTMSKHYDRESPEHLIQITRNLHLLPQIPPIRRRANNHSL